MPKAKIISALSPNIARAEMPDKTEQLVIYGDLFTGQTIDVIVEGKAAFPIEFNYDLVELTVVNGDKDGLIMFSKLTETTKSRPNDRIYEIQGKWVFVDIACRHMLEAAYEAGCVDKSRIKVTKSRHVAKAGARLYGIDFVDAVKKTMIEGISKTHLYLSRESDDLTDGFACNYIVKLTKSKNGQMELNSWQSVGQDSALYFVHGILNRNQNGFEHLDFAMHFTTSDEIVKLVLGGKDKPILETKKKIFRLDTDDDSIGFDFAFSLMSLFFPNAELVEEYYSHIEV